jgi:hypothetical protein
MGTKKFRSELILSGAPMSKDIKAGQEARNFCRRRDKIDDFGMHGKNKSASPARDKNEQLFFDTHLFMRVFPAKKDMIYSSRVCTCPCKPMRSRDQVQSQDERRRQPKIQRRRDWRTAAERFVYGSQIRKLRRA